VKSASLLLLAGAAVGLAVSAVNGQSTEAPSLRAGAYTEEQAIRGQTLYNERCSQCHGEALAGLDQAPPLAGPLFGSVWQGEPLWALVVRIGTMPPDRPGSLSRAEAVDLLSYILWYNGLPAGKDPLGVAQTTLTEIPFDSPALSGR
jgi:mono/diheme cytochrome c family protein